MIILPNRLLFHKYFTFARHIHTHTHTHTARVVMNRPSTCHFSFDTFFHKLGNFFLFQKNYFFALFFKILFVLHSLNIFSFRPPGTPWTRLATLINLLSRFDTRQVEISNNQLAGTDIIFHRFSI
jgi:hypothetical protein